MTQAAPVAAAPCRSVRTTRSQPAVAASQSASVSSGPARVTPDAGARTSSAANEDSPAELIRAEGDDAEAESEADDDPQEQRPTAKSRHRNVAESRATKHGRRTSTDQPRARRRRSAPALADVAAAPAESVRPSSSSSPQRPLLRTSESFSSGPGTASAMHAGPPAYLLPPHYGRPARPSNPDAFA